jgi:hypothetical protein
VPLACDGLQYCCVSDIDECSKNLDNCDKETQICNNSLGGFNCSCREGYEGDGSGTSCRAKLNQSQVISIALGKYFILTLFIDLFLFLFLLGNLINYYSIKYIIYRTGIK